MPGEGICSNGIDYSVFVEFRDPDSTRSDGSSRPHCAPITMTASIFFSTVIFFVLFTAAVLLATVFRKHPAVVHPLECEGKAGNYSSVLLPENHTAGERDNDNEYCSTALPAFHECGDQQTDRYVFGRRKKRVVGGTPVTNPSYYPWMAKLLHEFNSTEGLSDIKHNCGATVISDRYLLTAAHCVRCNALEEVELRNKVRMKVDKVILYPGYKRTCVQGSILQPNGSREHDIALIRLKESIVDVKPICLPLVRCYSLDHNVTTSAKTAFVAGYGFTANDKAEASEVLHHAPLKVLLSKDCRGAYNKKGEKPMVMKESMICAGGEKGVDFCKGDSGGPFFISVKGRSMQIGIASFGSSTCGDGSPSVFTKLMRYMSWIKSETATSAA